MEEREGFWKSIWKGFTEPGLGYGPPPVVVPNEIVRPTEKTPAGSEAGEEPAAQTDTPKPH
jgi:hypothetical protein